MKKTLCCLLLFLTISLDVQAKLAHRYRFDQNGNDATGAMHGATSMDGGFTEAPFYGNDIPSGTIDIQLLKNNPGHAIGVVATTKPMFVVLPKQTIVASAIVTEAPYNADPSGVLDATFAVQTAINAVAAAKGGAVYMPAGKYRIAGNLTLPYNVVLQGAGDSPDGTVLLASAGRGEESADPFIEAISINSGLLDLCIYYPEQTPNNIVPYPPTIKVYMAVTLRNVLLCNAYTGIVFDHYNASVLENVNGTVLKRGIFVPFSSEFGWMRDITFSNDFWEAAVEIFAGAPMNALDRASVDTFTKTHLIGLELQRLDGLVIDGFDAADAYLPVFMQPNPNETSNVFGLGGVVYDFPQARTEDGWAPWYYGMHYANLDNVPEVNDRHYAFAPIPMPLRTDVFIDVTDAPYGAVGDGIADDSGAITQALSDAGTLGGGTVYLPTGTYRITAALTVPDGVTLRGAMGASRVREYSQSCMLAFEYGHDTPNPLTDMAQITLGNHAGVRGFAIYCPLQSYDVTQIKPYPYAIRGNGSDASIVEMVLINAWFGIDLATHQNDGFLVRDIWGTVYYKGIDVGGGSVGVTLERTAFSFGVLLERGWGDPLQTPENSTALRQFVKDNALYYAFGATTNLTTWGIVGFLPKTQSLFYEQDGASTNEAEFWMSMFDVAKHNTIALEQGGEISWFGLFATGYNNWLDVDPAFGGSLNIYGKTIQQAHQPNALVFTQQQGHFFDEVSLTTGRNASADQTEAGSTPNYAVDRDPRTMWQAPAGSYLEVDLGSVRDIDRFDVQSDLFGDVSQNITQAELHVSTDGANFVKVATHTAPNGNAPYWLTMPIEETSARYVRLIAQSAAGTIRVGSFNLFNTSMFPEAFICYEIPAGDISGPAGTSDCIVDFYDIIALASDWLNCNRDPQSECP